MLHGKTMKFIVFLDPSSIIFLWQYKLVNTNSVIWWNVYFIISEDWFRPRDTIKKKQQ